MTRCERSVLEASLERKGFELQESHHHYYVYRTTSGKLTSVKTKTSHTPKLRTIDDSLFAKIARQCRLSTADMKDLVDCPLSRANYEKKLIAGGSVVL